MKEQENINNAYSLAYSKNGKVIYLYNNTDKYYLVKNIDKFGYPNSDSKIFERSIKNIIN